MIAQQPLGLELSPANSSGCITGNSEVMFVLPAKSHYRQLRARGWTFAFSSPILEFVFGMPPKRLCDYVVRCKGCHQNVPAPVGTMPDTWIVARCPLCGEKRRYLPSEIFKGKLSPNLGPKPVRSAGGASVPNTSKGVSFVRPFRCDSFDTV